MGKQKRIWRESQHPRDGRGRFAKRGGAAWVKRAAAELSTSDATRGEGGRPRISRNAKAGAVLQAHTDGGRPSAVRVPQATKSAAPKVPLTGFMAKGLPTPVKRAAPTVKNLDAFNAPDPPRKAAAPTLGDPAKTKASSDFFAQMNADAQARVSAPAERAVAASVMDRAKTEPVGTVLATGRREASNTNIRLVVAERDGRRHVMQQTQDKGAGDWDDQGRSYNADDLRASMRNQSENTGVAWAEAAPKAPAKRTPRPASGAAALIAARANEQTPQAPAMTAARTAPESAPVQGAEGYAAMKRHTLVSLARAAGVPHRGKTNTEVGEALAAKDAEVKASRAAKLNPGGIGSKTVEDYEQMPEPYLRRLAATAYSEGARAKAQEALDRRAAKLNPSGVGKADDAGSNAAFQRAHKAILNLNLDRTVQPGDTPRSEELARLNEGTLQNMARSAPGSPLSNAAQAELNRRSGTVDTPRVGSDNGGMTSTTPKAPAGAVALVDQRGDRWTPSTSKVPSERGKWFSRDTSEYRTYEELASRGTLVPEFAPKAEAPEMPEADLDALIRSKGLYPDEFTTQQKRDWLKSYEAAFGPVRLQAENDASKVVKDLKVKLRAMELDRETRDLNGDPSGLDEDEEGRAKKAERAALADLKARLLEAERAERGYDSTPSRTFAKLSNDALERAIKAARPGTKKLEDLKAERDARAAARFKAARPKADAAPVAAPAKVTAADREVSRLEKRVEAVQARLEREKAKRVESGRQIRSAAEQQAAKDLLNAKLDLEQARTEAAPARARITPDAKRGALDKANQDATAAKRTANLEKARAAATAQHVDILKRSDDPKDNSAKIKAIQDGRMESADLYRQIMAGPSGQRSRHKVGRVRYTPDNQTGEYMVTAPGGERVGYATATVRGGESKYAVYSDNGDGGTELLGWADTLAHAADVLTNGEAAASTGGTLDARRISGRMFERNPNRNKTLAELERDALDREIKQVRESLADPNIGPQMRTNAARRLASLEAERQGAPESPVDTPRVKSQNGGMTTTQRERTGTYTGEISKDRKERINDKALTDHVKTLLVSVNTDDEARALGFDTSDMPVQVGDEVMIETGGKRRRGIVTGTTKGGANGGTTRVMYSTPTGTMDNPETVKPTGQVRRLVDPSKRPGLDRAALLPKLAPEARASRKRTPEQVEEAKTAERAANAKRRQDFFNEKIERVTESLTGTGSYGSQAPEWHLQMTTEEGLVSLAKHLGVKVPNREKGPMGYPKPRDRDALVKSIVDAIRERPGKA